MLSKPYRLKKRKTFNYIYRRGKSFGCDCVTAVFVPARMPNAPHIKIGFSASKKVGNSVQRHRAVRVMRHAVKPFLKNIKPHHNIIFVAKEILLQKTLAEVSNSCKNILCKAQLLQGGQNEHL